MRRMTVVMRNGASFNVQTVMRTSSPYALQVDTTMHPAWTGVTEGISLEDERIMRLMKKFQGMQGFGMDTANPASETPSEK